MNPHAPGRSSVVVRSRHAALGTVLSLALAIGPVAASDLRFLEFHTSGIGGVTDLDHANTCKVTPDGSNVYVAANASHAVVRFQRDPATGHLTFIESYVDGVGTIDGLHNCVNLAVSPDGANLYTAAQGDDAIAVFDIDPATGALTWLEAHFDDIAGVEGLDRVFDVTVSPDGKNVYAGSIDDDAVAVFSRDPATGRLTFMEAQVNYIGGVSGLNSVIGVDLDSQGEFLYAAAMWSHAVTVFSRDHVTGALTYVDSFYHPDLQGTANVVVGFQDEQVFASSLVGDSLLVLDRDPSTGLLSHVETHTDDVAGVTGLTSPEGVIVESKAGLVMAFGSESDSVAVFRHNPATGGLEFIGAEFDGLGGVEGLADPSEGCIDPQSRNLHVASWDDNALSVFLISLFADGFESGDTTSWSGP